MSNENLKWDFFNEDESKKTTLLGKIKQIGETALEPTKWTDVAAKYENELCEFSHYLKATEFQTAVFIAVFYNIYFQGDYSTTVKDIAQFFSTKQIMLLEHKKEILQMHRLGILKNRARRRAQRPWDDDDNERNSFSDMEFTIPDSVVESIVNGKELKKDEPITTSKEFLLKINKMTNYVCEDEYYDIYEEVTCLEDDCLQDLTEISNVIKRIPNLTSRILFYLICVDTICARGGVCDLEHRISQFIESSYDQNELLKRLISQDGDEENQHFLVKEKLIEINEAKMAEDATANATNDGLDLMFGENAKLYKKQMSKNDLIEAEKIVEKKLFFTGTTEEQLNRMRSAFDEKKFSEIQERLSKKGMCQGIAALLYGAPGTGKTESVYQIAKETGRDIYHVDISQTKTMWYGESPKLVKKIFRRYKDMCKVARTDGKNIPILLLNEADALITTRKNVSGDSSACDKEDNTIQNVVLEEMENFEGIMIATTNLATNMDDAFERRFLFKVEFKKPDADGRAKIWKSKIKSLGDEDAKEIASDYDFSGGEIDNITRKMELEEVISGIKPDVKKIRELCRTEKIATASSGRAIGFGLAG